TYECGLVGRNIVDGLRHRPDDGQIPACLYTVPDLASVGLTEANAKEQGLGVRVHVNDIAGLAIRETYAETVAWSKVIVDETADRVVRAHLVGHAGFRALP
ncbi:MAG: NAD(P)/FAD-dependent oxidoreductase, partial [Mesorhizobium sp.]